MIHLFLILRATFAALMSSTCSHLRFDLVPKLIPMVGQSVLLFIWVKMLEEETQESFITLACLVLIFVKGPISAEIYVNIPMVFLNTGCTLTNIELDPTRMAQLATVVYNYLPIDLKTCDHYMYPLDQAIILLNLMPLL